MPTNHESDTNELDGRTKLLSSRPEPDNILLWGLCTLIGSIFCILGLGFLVFSIIENCSGLSSIFLGLLEGLFMLPLLLFPVAYTLYALDMLVWQMKGVETVSYDENGIVIHLKKLFDRKTIIPWNSIVKVEKFEKPWWTFSGGRTCIMPRFEDITHRKMGIRIRLDSGCSSTKNSKTL